MSLFKKRTEKPKPKPELQGERRQLTVLFYDIVGSTRMIGSHDAEEMRAALEQIHVSAREVFAEHGGHLEQIMGDGGMAYFGYPTLAEDAPLKAVQAAMALLSSRAEIDHAPDIRIGIATSIVVMSEPKAGQSGGHLGAVGVAPNLAARLEAQAPVNDILVAPATYALTRRAVSYRPVDGLEMKGFPDVSRAFTPVALADQDTTYAETRDGEAAFTGRSVEIGRLKEAWATCRAGQGTAILLEGEAGIGKSRLLSEIAAAADGHRTLILQAQPRAQGEPLYPILRMFDRAYEADLDPELCTAAVDLAERLGTLEDDETLSTEARRTATVEAVTQSFERLARKAPLLILAEDLHWVDEVTLAVLETLALTAYQDQLMVLATARPDPSLDASKECFSLLPLGPMLPEMAEALVSDRAPDLLPEGRDWILSKADGNPLFLIELAAYAQDRAEAGDQTDALSGAEVDSLRDLLAIRIETAGVAKRTAQLASVLGREYPYHLLARLAADRIGPELDADLQRLSDHGLKEALSNGYLYGFRHALIRDVAYDSQLRALRRELHRKVVELVDADPGLSDDVPDVLLAEHCLAAEQITRGVDLLLQVAEDAIRRSGLKGPRAVLERVLSLTAGLEPGETRDLFELRAIALLGPLVTALDGPKAAEPLYNTGQALYFKLQLSDRARFFPVLWGWWFTASDLHEQARRSDILIRDVPPEADAESRLQALHCGWASLFDGGHHARCLSAISEGLALYDPDIARSARHLYGHDAKVCGLGERALSGWLTGQLELSAEAVAACEAWADTTEHRGSLLHGLDIASQVAVFRQDLGEVDRLLSKIAGLSDAEALPTIRAKQQIFRGWRAARAGDSGQADAVADGLRQLRSVGVLEDLPFYADIAADIAAGQGQTDAALGALNEEIEDARATGLTYWLPELLRRKAILSGQGAGAAAALDDGYAVALGQGAHMLLLRNAETRLDLGIALPPELATHLEEHRGILSETELLLKVRNAVAP